MSAVVRAAGVGLLAMMGFACGAGKSPPYGDRVGGADAGDSFAGGGGAGGGAGGLPTCVSAADCPTSYTCEVNVCTPPEAEINRTVNTRPPVATPNYVYALNPSADSVARIDPRTLSIEAIPVGPNPLDLVAIPGVDAALALSFGDGTVTLIDSTSLPSRLSRLELGRQHARLAVSPDGKFAIAFPHPDVAPSAGAEGIVTVIDLQALLAGLPPSKVRFERAAGYRITDVLFRVETGAATRAYVVAKNTLSIIDLKNLATSPLPTRVDLPASMSADIRSREVVADKNAASVLIRSTTAPELAYFDGTTMRTVTLTEVATDLELFPDGSAAVAALRVAKQLALIDIPGDLLDPSGIALLDTLGAAVGQVEIPPAPSPSGNFALVFTNATADESFARVDLPGGKVTKYGLEKLVDEIALSPDGLSAVIVHRPDPASTATDPYERAVDADQGYSIFDVATGYAQLKRTGKSEPGPFAFSPLGGFLGVALKDDTAKRFSLDAVNLRTLVATTVPLASKPLFMGSVPVAAASSPHRVFVSQSHPAGRISVVNLDDGQIRTATGFTLNAEIQ